MDKANLDRFRSDVFRLVDQIPRGKVTTYGALASVLGYPRHARLVGKFMQQSYLYAPSLPAHRVVGSQGKLNGSAAFGNVLPLERRLSEEGIEVKNQRIVRFQSVFWDPLVAEEQAKAILWK